jgi:putative DNA primase/helicase
LTALLQKVIETPLKAIDDTVSAGGRNDYLTRLAGAMRHRGMSQAGIEAGLLIENAERCRPPLLDTEVCRIARSIAEYAPAVPLSPAMHYTDLGNAESLIACFEGIFHYCKPYSKWFIWSGANWRPDDTGQIKAYTIDMVKQMYAQALSTADPEARKRLIAHTLKSELNARINGLIQLAEGLPGVGISPSDLDQNGMLLNCENGTLDLRTGILVPHK